jgi:prepilin peptidase CpaA
VADVPGVLSLAAIAVGSLAAAAIDLRTRRVPNVLTGIIAGTGLVMAVASWGPIGAGAACAGGLIGLALMLPGYLFGGTGGGDVKLLAALGTMLGPQRTVTAFIAMALAGGVIALMVFLCRRWAGNTDRRFAYAPAVAFGALLAALR